LALQHTSDVIPGRDAKLGSSAVQVKAFVELVSSLLSASITNPSSQDGASPPGLAGEMLRVMKEAGVLKGLTNALKLVDTDHPQVDWKPCVKLALPAQQGTSSRQAC
jgi:hypothetical protein